MCQCKLRVIEVKSLLRNYGIPICPIFKHRLLALLVFLFLSWGNCNYCYSDWVLNVGSVILRLLFGYWVLMTKLNLIFPDMKTTKLWKNLVSTHSTFVDQGNGKNTCAQIFPKCLLNIIVDDISLLAFI